MIAALIALLAALGAEQTRLAIADAPAPTEAAPQTAGTPLRALAAELRTAATEGRARAAIDRLKLARSGALGLPDERLGQSPPAFLRAATFDELLAALDDVRTRFPELKAEVEVLVGTWDLCAIGSGTSDLRDGGGFVLRSPGSRSAALGAGLRAFNAIDEKGEPGPACTPEAQRQAAADSGQPAQSGSVGDGRLPDPPDFISQSFAATPGAAGASPSMPSPNGLGLSGRFYASWLLRGRALLGANATWTPYKFFFVRGGAGVRLGKDLPGDSGNGAFLTFGAGYDDWHPKTFSLQINYWEPWFPDRGLDARKLLLSAAYKLPRLCFQATICLSPVAYLDVPLKWDEAGGYVPTAGGRLTFSPREDLYLLLGVGVTLKGPVHARWIYSAGRWSYKPWSWSAAYENFGPNNVPDANFIDNGQVTLGLNWSF